MNPRDYCALDATALADLIRTGQITAREVEAAARSAIEAVNPQLNAVVGSLFEKPLAANASGRFAGVPFVIKDLVVDRSAFDRIIESGGYISAPTGSAIDANMNPIPKPVADAAMDAAACIGCGACVAACPNSAAQLFTSAKLAHMNLMPQGQPERWKRTEAMVETMEQFFGSCTNHGECQEACPKEISIDFIAMMNRDYVKSKIKNRQLLGQK